MNPTVTFTGKGQVELMEFPVLECGRGLVRIKTRTSLISTGTEGICFNRLFEPGTHWDHWVKYPFKTGYSVVCDVVEVGSEVTSLRVGDRVFGRFVHAREHVVDPGKLTLVPAEVADEDAHWSALSMIGSMCLKTADIRLEDEVAIIGAGPIGQMALRWCRAAGCRVTICDTIPGRLEMAEMGGAFQPLLGTADQLADHVRSVFGRQPRVVVDSTGFAAVFATALGVPRDHGVLALLGDTGTPSLQCLTPDVLRRGVKIHGVHISHETPDWYEDKAYLRFYDLLMAGRFSLKGLNTHRFTPDQCVEAYDLTTHRRAETMGVWFDWR